MELGHFQGGSVIGVAMLHGRLRLVCATHAPIPDFLALLQQQLATHLAAPALGPKGTVGTGYLRG